MDAERPELILGHAYSLSGIARRLWASAHPRYGRPQMLVGVYRGSISASVSVWYGFEIYVRGVSRATVFIPDYDLQKINVHDLGVYP